MAKDPICGMTVNEHNPKTLRLEVKGTTYYFCAETCRAKFSARQTAL